MHFLKKTAPIALLLIAGISLCHAQKIYKGTVIDQITRQPVEYAVVSATGKGTTTDKNGDFRLNLPADSATLTVSFIGYTIQQVKAEHARPLLISLNRGSIDLKEVVILPGLNNNSFHTLGNIDLNVRPINSSQDLMRLVPGLFIAQHMGGGKAEQIFVRGFDADHGTDVNVSVDGMPVNMVSHIHGQGYADLHFLIPETIATFDYGKGPYYTGYGDFTTAAYLAFNTKDAPDKSTISLERGQFNTFRAAGLIDLLNAKAKQNGENAYIAGEYNYTDGAFKLPEHYKRTNLFAKYSKQLGEGNKLTLSASTFSTSWVASGEIPQRAVGAGSTALDDSGNPITIPAAPVTISRFGTIDSAQGGKTSRVNALAKLSTNLGNNWTMDNQLYYTHYKFLLHVNSTFFALDSVNGDEKQQHEERDMFGYNGKLSNRKYWGNNQLTSAVGLSSRFDRTYGTDYSFVTQQYRFLSNVTHGDIRQNNTGLYLDETFESGKWLLNAGSRLDYFSFNFAGSTKTEVIASPKLNVQYTANNQVQFYLKAGKGFHSNNAIAVIGNKGLQTLPAAYGADLGLNWKPMPHLYINAAAWYLYLQQEFIYTDDGDIAPGGRTRRMGADLSARYQLASWLFAAVNLNLARPRLADSAAKTGYLPLAPTFTSTGGLDFKLKNGINGGLSYRYMHNRPGNNTYTLKADGYFVTDLKVNYTQKRYEVGLTIENLLNTQWQEYAVEQVSRLRGEAAPVDQMSFTPGTPFFAKLRVAVFF
ncbi:TonB-dependent receptor [uncultured Mucilaginibacter sp.]|uniref:TonB-dependent receptor n=1 Tax=uncultured Mucilaginibacter sp. TaxID=797541 RepID=UPI0025D6EA03|nr:TonB-dependent receptor [uncultured Mucilaginibacter sp.]